MAGKKHGREYRWLCVCVFAKHARFWVTIGMGKKESVRAKDNRCGGVKE